MPGLFKNTDPDTSVLAALAANVTDSEPAVLVTLANAAGPLTAEEVAKFTGIPVPAITPRFRPLVNKGLIFDTGTRRKNLSGRKAIVWGLKKAQLVS